MVVSTAQQPKTSQGPTVQMSLQEYGRGIAGGLLFSLPLLFTMEMWWFGFIIRPFQLVIYVAVTFVLLLGYNRFAGLYRKASWLEVVIDSFEEMGIGLVLSTLILVLLGRITLDMPADEAVGKVVIAAMTVAIGVSVGTAQLGIGGEDEDNGGMQGDTEEDLVSLKNEVVLGFCAAVLFAGNIAPTEEVVLLGAEMSPWNLIGLAGLSMVLGALILFYSDFVGTREIVPEDASFVYVITRTVITYCVALVAAALMLWFFGRFTNDSLSHAVSQTVALGMPATLGASAGRLLIR